MVYQWQHFIQQLIYPPRCLLCGAPGEGDRDLCADCHQALEHNQHACRVCALPLPTGAAAGSICGRCLRQRPVYGRCHAALVYDALCASLISQLKFNRRLSHARLLSQLLIAHLQAQAPARPDLILPVPLHAKRLKERGYNQALEIARPVGRHFGLPVLPRLCRRVRMTPAQVNLDRQARRKNLRNAFKVTGTVAGKTIALLDDVVTTGTTVSELARCLKRAGAARVDVWAVARTPREPA